MSADPNVFEPTWDDELHEGPFRGRAFRVGGHTGARELGATLYELEPGATSPPYHVHHGNEEMLIVLSGSPELRCRHGKRRLRAGAAVAFRRGTDGAHQLHNTSAHRARVLLISTMHSPDIVEWLDTGTIQAIAGPSGHTKVFPAAAAVPFFDELRNAGRVFPAPVV